MKKVGVYLPAQKFNVSNQVNGIPLGIVR